MANWCFNMVVFQGEDSQLEKLDVLIQQMIKKQKAEEKGQLFPMVKVEKGFLFQISYQDGVLCYLTKWEPNTEVLLAVADELCLDYSHNYDEPAMGVYGLDIYKDKQLNEAHITTDDHLLYSFEESKSCYLYDGGEYEELNDVFDLILLRKVNSNHLLNNGSHENN